MTPQRLDFLDIMTLNPALKQNLSGRYDVRDEAHKRIFSVKNPNGYPVDRREYARLEGDDDEYVYDGGTEGDPPHGWDNPKWFKLHLGNLGRGNRMMKRWIQYPFTGTIEVTGAQSPFWIFNDSVWDGAHHQVRAYKFVLHAPVPRTWGKLGSVPTWLLEYFYNGGLVPGTVGLQFNSMETNEFGFDPATAALPDLTARRQYGLLHWTNNKKDATGHWVKTDENKPSTDLRPFKGKTEDGRHDQDPRLVVCPILGIDGVVPQ